MFFLLIFQSLFSRGRWTTFQWSFRVCWSFLLLLHLYCFFYSETLRNLSTPNRFWRLYHYALFEAPISMSFLTNIVCVWVVMTTFYTRLATKNHRWDKAMAPGCPTFINLHLMLTISDQKSHTETSPG